MMQNSEQFKSKVTEVTGKLTAKVFVSNKPVTDEWGHTTSKLLTGHVKGYPRKKALLSVIGREELNEIQLNATLLPFGESKDFILPNDVSVAMMTETSQQILTYLQEEAENMRWRNRQLGDILFPVRFRLIKMWLLSKVATLR